MRMSAHMDKLPNFTHTQFETTAQDDLKHAYEKGLELEHKSRASNTIKRYQSAFKVLQSYCDGFKVTSMPLTPEIAYAFFVYLHNQSYSWSTIAVIKASIDYHHKTQGHLSPLAHPRIDTLLQGIQRDISRNQNASDPVTYDMLIKIIDRINANDLLSVRDRALLLVGFSGGFRASELLALKNEDVNFNDAHGMIVTIKQSKTDQLAKGHEVAIPFNSKSTRHCPVKALQHWLEAIGLKDQEYIFKSLHKGGCKVRNEQLSYEGFYRLFKKRCQQADLNTTNLSPHGLRSGFNTSAALAGANLVKMREITNQSLNTQQRYIKKVNLFENNANNNIYAYFDNDKSAN